MHVFLSEYNVLVWIFLAKAVSGVKRGSCTIKSGGYEAIHLFIYKMSLCAVDDLEQVEQFGFRKLMQKSINMTFVWSDRRRKYRLDSTVYR